MELLAAWEDNVAFPRLFGEQTRGRRMSTSEKFDWRIDSRLTSYDGATRLGQSPPIWVKVFGRRSIHVTT